MKLIDNWRQSWRFSSVQAAMILAVVNGVFALLQYLAEVVSLPTYAAISVLGNLSVVVLRLVAQPSLQQDGGGNEIKRG